MVVRLCAVNAVTLHLTNRLYRSLTLALLRPFVHWPDNPLVVCIIKCNRSEITTSCQFCLKV